MCLAWQRLRIGCHLGGIAELWRHHDSLEWLQPAHFGGQCDERLIDPATTFAGC